MSIDRPINATPKERPTSKTESLANDAPVAPTERTSSVAAIPTNDDEKKEKKKKDKDEEIEESKPPTPRKGSFGYKRRA
ncbi:bfa4ef63-0142-422c-8557-30e7a83b9a1d [Thermothielavioides terrestris]|uniref:Bfa4ef63-0142-422c-8557-30e7a83b9a1d n=1 Tax=Thermothielavioides terrestris TaxID=2587410 RepID=A0A3S4CZA0_9PEZI|nr:bfa4ef63-0142-422c-8557-30e7a83b9a1d [Thermothielavioides terrestris]